MEKESSRPEAAFILLLMQATFWAMAGLSGLPFVLAGEVYMLALGVASIALAGLGCVLAVGLVMRRRWARRGSIVLEWICLIASLVQIALPLGANRGSVAMLVNIALPLAVILLLRGKRMRRQFGIAAAPAE